MSNELSRFVEVNAHFGRALAQTLPYVDVPACLRALERKNALQPMIQENLHRLLEGHIPLLLKGDKVELSMGRKRPSVRNFFSRHRTDMSVDGNASRMMVQAAHIIELLEYTRRYYTLQGYTLSRDARPGELRVVHEVMYTHPGDIALLLKDQPGHRQAGALLANGDCNFFFMPGFVVSVRAHGEEKPWSACFAWDHNLTLYKGSRVFLPE